MLKKFKNAQLDRRDAFQSFKEGVTDLGERQVTKRDHFEKSKVVGKNKALFEGGDDDERTAINKSLNSSMNQSLKEKLLNMTDQQKSINRHTSMDLFLLLDRENDMYLKYTELLPLFDEIQELKESDRGNAKTEQDFIKEFRSFGQY